MVSLESCMYDPYDFYFKKAKKTWYKARSIFKLEEIQDKFHIFDKNTKKVLDIWCAPGSWMQYTSNLLKKLKVTDFSLLWFDIKEVDVNILGVETFVQDVTDIIKMKEILESKWFEKVDLIQSDMAPNTVWVKNIDAIRSIWLLEETLRLYKEVLKPEWKFAIKVFMWPGFDEFVNDLKKHFGAKHIKVFKPKSCRSESKETYVVKI